MKIRIAVEGKIRTGFIKDGIKEYIKRLSPYLTVKVEMVKNFSPKRERKNIFFVCLDKLGREMDSIAFSDWFGRLQNSGEKEIQFCVGGVNGFPEEVLKEADDVISLSKLTFTHEFAVLFLVEQIYRAFRIIRGEPYHY